jgi:3-deoxy-manno-octulosonate cytidylyltransferase (CMP-KDO synthetase)
MHSGRILRAGVATLAAVIERKEDWLNPNNVKVVKNKAVFAEYFSRAPIPFMRDVGSRRRHSDDPRTSSGPCVTLASTPTGRAPMLEVAAHPAVVHEQCESLEQLRALWLGIPIHVSVVDQAPPHGVDTPDDLRRVEEVLKKRGHGA